MMGELAVLAEAFRYPQPGHLTRLRRGAASLPSGSVRTAIEGFTAYVARLSLGEWEELCTRTLELNPAAAPYLGYAIWGENYARGRFLAMLNGAMRAAGTDLDGELPDHLVPVLRYLDRAPEPIPELTSVLEPALRSIYDALERADPANPYLRLLAATMLALSSHLEQEHACQ